MDKNNSSVDYLGIVKKSWKTAISNRYLWWFGLFLAVSGSSSGGYFNYSFPVETKESKWEDDWTSQVDKQQVLDFLTQYAHWIILGFLLLFLLLIVFVILGNLGRGALIDSIDKQEKGQGSNFKAGLSAGRKNFWKVFTISFLTGIFILSTLIVLGVPILVLFLSEHYFVGFLMLSAGIFILAVLVVLTTYIRSYGYLYVVLGKINFWAAIESAYNLFRNNVAKSLIMGIIFIPLNILLTIAIVGLALAVALIFLGPGLALYLALEKVGLAIAVTLAALVFVVGAVFLKSVYVVFTQAVWVNFFYEIAKKKKEEVVIDQPLEIENVTKALPAIEWERK